MQREAELLMLAVQQRHQRETAFLERVMVSIAKASEAQNEMIVGIEQLLKSMIGPRPKTIRSASGWKARLRTSSTTSARTWHKTMNAKRAP